MREQAPVIRTVKSTATRHVDRIEIIAWLLLWRERGLRCEDSKGQALSHPIMTKKVCEVILTDHHSDFPERRPLDRVTAVPKSRFS
jgi:hypothetical protein